MSVARNQRGALTQAGAGIAASRRTLVDFARPLLSVLAQRPACSQGAILRRFITMGTTGFARLGSVLAIAITLSGCALTVRRPSVAELKYNPGRYHDRTVSIDGVVTSAWGVPLVPFKLYKVNDGTGEVTVIANDGRTPTKGARVRVKGRVADVATLGGQAVGLHIQQKDVDFRR
jgi:hypothetical protein